MNITGGGFYDNIVRILPKNTKAIIKKNSWKPYKIFDLIQKKVIFLIKKCIEHLTWV